MSSAPLNIAQAADLVDKSIQNIWLKSAGKPNEQYKKYFNFRTSTDLYEKDSGLSGLGEANFVEENAVITSDVPVQTYGKSYEQEMVATIISFTYKMWKFGIKKRDLTNVVSDLRNADLRVRERLCAERLDNGFETISYTHQNANGTSRVISIAGGDGLGAFDDDHTREDGGTNMNNIVYDGTTYNLAFDYAGVKAALRTASLFVDPRGNPYIAKLDTLVVKTGSNNYFKAMEILGAIKKGTIPESTDNDGAGVPAFKIIQLDYLDNAAYWYMFDSSRMSDRQGFQFVESEAPIVDPVNIVYSTKEIQTSAHSLFDLGHNDVARMWVGSLGDKSNPTS